MDKMQNQKKNTKPDFLSYGSSALIHSISNDILNDLLEVFEPKRAFTIMALAALKVIKPGIVDCKVSEEYYRTFISEYYSGATVSKNSLTNLHKELGMYGEPRKKFFEKRLLQSENQSLKLNQVFFHHFIFLYPKEKPNFIGIRTTYISLIL